jgi:phosphoribosylglycinamide formyltransferase-1
VLASGAGTILDALLGAGIDVAVVVVDRPCRATEIAGQAGLPSATVARTSFGKDFDRLGHTKEVIGALQANGAELVAIAGYGTILDAVMYEAFPDRVLNTHPSLLPAFKGWHAVEEALAYGVKVTGCTVHVATTDVDAGPILAQEPVEVLPEDTVESLHERIKKVERRLYPETIARYAAHLTATSAGAPPNEEEH